MRDTLEGWMISTAIWWFLLAPPAVATDYTEYSATCSCAGAKAKNPDYENCTATATPTVTIKSKGTDSEKIAESLRKKCATALNNPGPCPSSMCDQTMSNVTPPVAGLSDGPGESPQEDIAHQAGVKQEHIDALKQLAEDRKWTIIVRASNIDSLPYQDDYDKYRPKPHDVLWFKTRKGGQSENGLIDCGPIPSTWSDEAIAMRSANRDELEGWKCVNGILVDPDGRKVFSDYDLQGIYQHHEDGTITLVDLNDEALQRDINQTAFPERSEDTNNEHFQFLIQHGANDNYRKEKLGKDKLEAKDLEVFTSIMGRMPLNDEEYLVINPDGTDQVIEGSDNLEAFYGGQLLNVYSGQPVNIKWMYGKYPRKEKKIDNPNAAKWSWD